MEKYKKRSISDKLDRYDYLSDDNGFIEITEWNNGEGIDVSIESISTKLFGLTWGEFRAIKKLVKHLRKSD